MRNLWSNFSNKLFLFREQNKSRLKTFSYQAVVKSLLFTFFSFCICPVWAQVDDIAKIEKGQFLPYQAKQRSYSSSTSSMGIQSFGAMSTKSSSSAVTIFSEDFEQADSTWTLAGEWEIGIPAATIGSSKCAGTGLLYNYSDSVDYRIISPEIVLPTLSSAGAQLELTTFEKFSIESVYDNGYIEVSTDGGQSWVVLDARSGVSDWNKNLVFLTTYQGQSIKLAFHFVSDDSHNSDGWFIDDISIQEVQPEKLAIKIQNINADAFPFVYLNATVDTVGTGVSSLKTKDFKVSENGVLQTEQFEVIPPSEGANSRSADIVFLVDNSGSFGSYQAAVRNNMISFVDQLKNSSGIDFALGLCRFGQRTSSGSPFLENGGQLTKDADFFKNDIWARNTTDGGTEPAYHAITQSCNGFSFRPGTQKIFIILADENPNQGGSTQAQAIAAALGSSATVFSLTTAASAGLNVVATQTNGRYYNISDPFVDILNDISAVVGNSYVIKYHSSNPTEDGITRYVKVETTFQNEVAQDMASYIPASLPYIVRTSDTKNLESQSWPEQTDLTIIATIIDKIAPGVQSATLNYKNSTASTYTSIPMTNTGNSEWSATIPGASVKEPGVDYYITATDGQGTSSNPKVTPADNPFQIGILPNQKPVINFTPATLFTLGDTISGNMQITDSTNSVDKVSVYYRRVGQLSYTELTPVSLGGDAYHFDIVTSLADYAGLELYVMAWDNFGVSSSIGNSDYPLLMQAQYNVRLVIEDNAVPVAGVTVALDSIGSATTNSNGVALFSGLLGDTELNYTCTKQGYETITGSFSLQHEDYTDTLSMEKLGQNVSFSVVVNDGSLPIENASIVIDSLAATTTDVNGESAYTEVVAGTYNYIITANNCLDYSGTFTVVDKDVNVQVVMTSCKDNTIINQTIYQGGYYMFEGQRLTQSGAYEKTHTNVQGCDSIVSLNLTVMPAPTISARHFIPVYGDNAMSYMNVNFLAASINEMDLQVGDEIGIFDENHCVGAAVVINPMGTVEDALIVRGLAGLGESPAEGFTIGDNIWFKFYDKSENSEYECIEPTCYNNQFVELVGHPSFKPNETLFVSLKKDSSYVVQDSIIDVTLCQGDSTLFFGNYYYQTGQYAEVLKNKMGCDSTVILNLQVNPVHDIIVQKTICQGQSYDFNGTLYSTAGQYTVTLSNQFQCDSVVTLDLHVNPTYEVTVNDTICDGDAYPFHGQVYTKAGQYPVTLTSALQCDSIVTLDLFVNPQHYVVVNDTICEGDFSVFHGNIYNKAGQYTDTLVNEFGCDSIVTLDLIVNPVHITLVPQEICQGELYSFHGKDYGTKGVYVDTLTNAFGCDSIVILDLHVNPVHSEVFSDEICQGETYDFLGQSFTQTGQYPITLTNQFGCDSIVTLDLIVNPTYHDTISQKVCRSNAYEFDNRVLTQPGFYTKHLTSISGCDSLITLELVHEVCLVQNELELKAGWNIISSYSNPTPADMLTIFDPLVNQGVLVKVQDDKGRTVEDFGIFGGWQNGIGNWNPAEGYKIKVNQDVQFEVVGETLTYPFTIPLDEGWNLMSYPLDYEVDAMDILNDIYLSGNLVKVQNEDGQSIEDWGVFGNGTMTNNIGNFKPGKGYLIKVNAPVNLVIKKQYTKSARVMKNKIATSYFEPVFEGNGNSHMNFHLVNLDGTSFEIGSEIAIYDGDLCVGAAVVDADAYHNQSLSIATSAVDKGDDGFTSNNSYSIYVYDGDKKTNISMQEVSVQGGSTFEKNATVFVDMKEIKSKTSSIGTNSSTEVSCYPNPFVTDVKIDVKVVNTQDVSIAVYNNSGQEIRRIVSGMNLKSGSYQFSWDGKTGNGERVEAGLYLIQTIIGGEAKSIKVLLTD